MAPDNEVFSFVREWLWAPALGLIAWAWNRNEQEHTMLRERTDSLKQNTSDGYSVLNNRFVEYVDSKVGDVQDEQRRKTDKINDHITKLFENAERDRASFRDALATHSQQSSERHIELLSAIHTGLAKKADK